jgi:hypothetical protein
MPEKIIYCSECAAETKRIEESGRFRVVSCEPTSADPKKCLIVWQRKPPAAASIQPVAAAAEPAVQPVAAPRPRSAKPTPPAKPSKPAPPAKPAKPTPRRKP